MGRQSDAAEQTETRPSVRDARELTGGLVTTAEMMALTVGVAGLMLLVGLAAAYGPARSGLRVQPTEALRAD